MLGKRGPQTRRGPISAKVFVGNLNYRTTKEELVAFLSPAGEIVDAFLPTDRETGRPRGFGFVTFATPEQAAACIEQFNGAAFEGRQLNINPADDRRKGGPPRGPRGGGRREPVTDFRRGSGGGRFEGRPGGGGFRGRRDESEGGDGGERRGGFGGGERGGERRGGFGGGERAGERRGGFGGERRGFGGGGRGRGDDYPPIEPEGEVMDDRTFQEDDGEEGGEVDEWGRSSGWQGKKKGKKKAKGSRRGLRAKKRSL